MTSSIFTSETQASEVRLAGRRTEPYELGDYIFVGFIGEDGKKSVERRLLSDRHTPESIPFQIAPALVKNAVERLAERIQQEDQYRVIDGIICKVGPGGPQTVSDGDLQTLLPEVRDALLRQRPRR